MLIYILYVRKRSILTYRPGFVTGKWDAYLALPDGCVCIIFNKKIYDFKRIWSQSGEKRNFETDRQFK